MVILAGLVWDMCVVWFTVSFIMKADENSLSISLRIPDSYDAKIAKICNLLTLGPVI